MSLECETILLEVVGGPEEEFDMEKFVSGLLDKSI